jgi:hypothetical protein
MSLDLNSGFIVRRAAPRALTGSREELEEDVTAC